MNIQKKLVDYANLHKKDVNRTYIQYINERLLYRLSISQYKEQFAVKGAILFFFMGYGIDRPTKDIDMLGFQLLEQYELKQIFNNVLNIKPEKADGLLFNLDSIKTDEIRKQSNYGGVCVSGTCALAGVKRELPFHIDIGFGDIITPKAEEREMISILGMEPPKLKTYNVETVIAEKFEAMVFNGIINSRIKDFWDVYQLLSNTQLDIDDNTLRKAIIATFKRRKTQLKEDIPAVFSSTYYENPQRITQWKGFLKQLSIDKNIEFKEVVLFIMVRLEPIYRELKQIDESQKQVLSL